MPCLSYCTEGEAEDVGEGDGRRAVPGRAEGDLKLTSEQPCLTTEQAHNGKNRRPSDRDHDCEEWCGAGGVCGGGARTDTYIVGLFYSCSRSLLGLSTG